MLLFPPLHRTQSFRMYVRAQGADIHVHTHAYSEAHRGLRTLMPLSRPCGHIPVQFHTCSLMGAVGSSCDRRLDGCGLALVILDTDHKQGLLDH